MGHTHLHYNCNVDVYDPWVNNDQAIIEYNIETADQPKEGMYDAIVLAVAHDLFREFSLEQIKALGKDNHIIYDIKYLFNSTEVDGRI